MLKVVKTKITQEEFIKEVEALFPGKFTEEGLRVLFDKLDDCGEGEYELSKIGDDFEEWTFKRYQDYIVERYGKIGDVYDEPMDKKELESFLNEEVHEDDWSDSVVDFTDSTIMFTTYYTSKLAYELKKMYERMRTLSVEKFCEEFGCTQDTVEEVFNRYRDGGALDFSLINNKEIQIVHLTYRGKTDTEITFEQFEV